MIGFSPLLIRFVSLLRPFLSSDSFVQESKGWIRNRGNQVRGWISDFEDFSKHLPSEPSNDSCGGVASQNPAEPTYRDCDRSSLKWVQVAAVGPYDAFVAWGSAIEAKRVTRELEVQGIFREEDDYNGPPDAFRHCLWSGIMAVKIGPEQAEIVADNYEICGNNLPEATENASLQAQLKCEAQMDRYNNAWGRYLAQLGLHLYNRVPSHALFFVRYACFDATQNRHLQTHLNFQGPLQVPQYRKPN